MLPNKIGDIIIMRYFTIDKKKYAILSPEDDNPTYDFYFKQLVAHNDNVLRIKMLEELDNSFDVIIIIRYLDIKAFFYLLKKDISVYFFIDDDILDIKILFSLPFKYSRKLIQHAWIYKYFILKNNFHLVVSTPFLYHKYSLFDPYLLEPVPIYSLPLAHHSVIFYHATNLHNKDLLWLRPIIKEILSIHKDIWFECIGTKNIRYEFSDIPHVIVIPSMSSKAFFHFLAYGDRKIGLAPLLPTPFNLARSFVRFYNITSAGAVGIYASNSIYSRIVKNEYNGLLVPMDQTMWIDAINRLLLDENLYNALYNGAIKTYTEKLAQ